MITGKKISLALIAFFCLYAAARVMFNVSVHSSPGIIEDTTAYLRISREAIWSRDFWANARPFVLPLLLKVTGQNLPPASLFQLFFSIFSWGCLAFSFAGFLRNKWMKILSFNILLALSLVRHISSWDYMIMTESLSLSLFVLFLACGLFLVRDWKPARVILFIAAAFLFAFVRDTNAYLLLFLSASLIPVILLRWIHPRNFVLVLSFTGIFLLSSWTSELGLRWVFPLNNNIGRRILPVEHALQFFSDCGMPVTPELLALTNEFANGKDRAFYNDPALEEYRLWLYEDGKSCYVRYLLSDPLGNAAEVVSQFESLIEYQKIQKIFVPGYDPVIPFFLERFIYPVGNILGLWFLVTGAALVFLWRRQWRDDPIWGVYILLCLLIFPHLFITWFGDAMAPERHSLSVGLQFALCFWFLALLSVDRLMGRFTDGDIDGRMNAIGRVAE